MPWSLMPSLRVSISVAVKDAQDLRSCGKQGIERDQIFRGWNLSGSLEEIAPHVDENAHDPRHAINCWRSTTEHVYPVTVELPVCAMRPGHVATILRSIMAPSTRAKSGSASRPSLLPGVEQCGQSDSGVRRRRLGVRDGLFGRVGRVGARLPG
jgi:hypothetical protein